MPRVDVSFSGCGFLAAFHLGAAAALARHGIAVDRALGASAGSVVAAAVVLDVPEDKRRKRMQALTSAALRLHPLGAFHPEFHVSTLFRMHLLDLLPLDAHKRCSDRLTVSLTDGATFKNELVSTFHSRQDLLDCLICSCFLPAFSGYHVHEFRGKVYLDGGLTNNQPVLDRKTLRINPWAGDAHISPVDHPKSQQVRRIRKAEVEMEVTPENLNRLWRACWPTTTGDEDLYAQGYDLADAFISSRRFKELTH